MLDRPRDRTIVRDGAYWARVDRWIRGHQPDPLGEALHFLRMSGAFYCRSELSAPWGLTMPAMPGYLWFHVVDLGPVLLETGTDEADAAASPATSRSSRTARGTCLRSEPGRPAPGILELEREQVSDRYEILRHGGGGARTRLICGAVRFDHPAARNLVGILPAIDPHRRRRAASRSERMQATIRLMAVEAASCSPAARR